MKGKKSMDAEKGGEMKRKVFSLFLSAIGLSIFIFACGGNGDDEEGDEWENNPRLTASVPDPLEDLTAKAKQAVELAPSWLKYDLIDNLRKLTSQLQDEYSELILNPDDERYRDELAFLVAHTSTTDLTSSWMPELLVENVATAYENDEYLAYVEILDITEKDGDYYSTVKYAMPDGSSLQLPRDFYYWFVIHPRIEDETPAYINPETGSVANPPDGVFWRSYLFNHADENCQQILGCSIDNPDTCPTEPTPCVALKDMLQNALYMWEGHTTRGFDEFNANVEGTGAIELLVQWVNHVMCFGAYTQRPIQPVRIYHVHCGRCGEHADISNAAARAALLPAINASALSNDHVWNEFFDNDFYGFGTLWHEWEPVNWYINNFTSYDDDPDQAGWWPAFAIFSTRGDGYTYNRTPDYSETATIKVTVTDSQGKPVDGALVIIYGQRYGYLPVFAQLTDRNGVVEAEVGEGGYPNYEYDLKYYLKVKSALGDYPNYPSGNPQFIVKNPKVGDLIDLDVQLDGASDFPPFEDKEPTDGAGRYIAKLSYDLNKAIMYGDSILGGIIFSDYKDEGWATLLIFDRKNYEKYSEDKSYEPTAVKKISGAGTFEFDIPSSGCWYFVLLNDSVNATQIGKLRFELFDKGESRLSREDEIFLVAGKAAIYELCGL